MFDPRVDKNEKPSPYGGSGDTQPGVQALHHEGLKQPRFFVDVVVQLMVLQLASNVPVQVRLWSPVNDTVLPSTLPSPFATPWRMPKVMLNASDPVAIAANSLFDMPLAPITHGAPVISHPAEAAATVHAPTAARRTMLLFIE